MINVIAAHDQNRLIGAEGQIPWHLPIDMKHFRELTIGNVVVMGRRTYESIGRPLPKRENIVISTSVSEIDGCTVVSTFEQAIDIANELGEIWVIGGAQVYCLAMPVADQLHITEIDAAFSGDVYFPQINANIWKIASEEHHNADQDNPYNLTFRVYERL